MLGSQVYSVATGFDCEMTMKYRSATGMLCVIRSHGMRWMILGMIFVAKMTLDGDSPLERHDHQAKLYKHT
jgi:hypothetical protein